MPAARANSVLELIGNTPLLEITRLTDGLLRPGVRIFAKLEGFNPGGSVKDRAARKMIEFGLTRGDLRPGKVIIDSTSGNTGIALAMVGAALGYPVEIVMASNVSRERKKIIEAFGAKPIYSDPLEGSDGAMMMAARSSTPTPSATSNPTSTTTRPIRSPISIPPGPKSGIRPAAASLTSWPASAPAAP